MVRGNVIFSEKASADLISASDWYNEQKDGLGKDFLLAVDELLKKIERNPTLFHFEKGRVRKATLKKFPYYIFFHTYTYLLK